MSGSIGKLNWMSELTCKVGFNFFLIRKVGFNLMESLYN